MKNSFCIIGSLAFLVAVSAIPAPAPSASDNVVTEPPVWEDPAWPRPTFPPAASIPETGSGGVRRLSSETPSALATTGPEKILGEPATAERAQAYEILGRFDASRDNAISTLNSCYSLRDDRRYVKCVAETPSKWVEARIDLTRNRVILWIELKTSMVFQKRGTLESDTLLSKARATVRRALGDDSEAVLDREPMIRQVLVGRSADGAEQYVTHFVWNKWTDGYEYLDSHFIVTLDAHN